MRRRRWLTAILLLCLADFGLLLVILFVIFGPFANAGPPPTLAVLNPPALVVSVLSATPSATNTSPPVNPASAPSAMTTYSVAAGDTLFGIAARFNVSLEAVIAANPNIKPDLLFPGDVIIIPPCQTSAEAGAALSASPTLVAVIHPTDPVTPPPPLDWAMARVSAEGAGLRLRQSPGTAGLVLDYLEALTPLTVIGRTPDNVWMQVMTPSGHLGWVMTQFVDVSISLPDMPVTGVALDATPTPNLPSPTSPPRPTAVNPQPTPGVATEPPGAPSATSVPGLALPTATQELPTPAPPGTQPAGYVYISGITDHARQILLQGLGLGNRPNVFSKVGDSITLSAVFMNPIGIGAYDLHDHTYLQPVIDYYSIAWARTNNSFANVPLAAAVAWTAGAVLNPANADQTYCALGEAPLVCEYRLVKPAVALIMLGTNDVPSTPADRYETNMRRVIETTIAMGVIPVLSTIPPLHRAGTEGRVELLNGIIIRLAHEYDVPLWDYWSALQGLPNDGLASDGVHPSWAPPGHSADFTPEYLQYGMTVRNLTGLQALDAVWRTTIAVP